jgi:hypothetical protein
MSEKINKDLLAQIIKSSDFKKLLTQVKEQQKLAPGYTPSDSLIQCQHCAHATDGNICALYNFPFIKNWKCDSYQIGNLQVFKGEKEKMDQRVRIMKADEDQKLVFGFFSINKVGQELVEDLEGDLIETDTLEKAAYNFVLNARIAGEEHIRKGVGRLVESVFFSYEKQNTIQKCLNDMGIGAKLDLGCEGWFGGFKVDSEEVWEAIKKGEYPAFSIGGSCKKIEERGL